jgi:hypothetical protein
MAKHVEETWDGALLSYLGWDGSDPAIRVISEITILSILN